MATQHLTMIRRKRQQRVLSNTELIHLVEELANPLVDLGDQAKVVGRPSLYLGGVVIAVRDPIVAICRVGQIVEQTIGRHHVIGVVHFMVLASGNHGRMRRMQTQVEREGLISGG